MKKPAHFLLLSTAEGTRELEYALADIKESYGEIIRLQKISFAYWEQGRLTLEEVEKAIAWAQVILVAIMGQTELTDHLLRLLPRSSATIVVLIGGSRDILALTRLGSFSGADLPMGKGSFDLQAYLRAKKFMELTKKMGAIIPMGKLKHMRNWLLACDYYAHGGRENFKNMLLFLLRKYCGAQVQYQLPKRRPDFGLWWPPDRYFTSLQSFQRAAGWEKELPAVGILFFGGLHFDDCTPVVEALLAELKGEVNFLPVFSRVEHNLTALRSFFFVEGRPLVNLVVNLQYFRLHGGPYGGTPEPTYRLLSELGAPVLIGFRSYATELERWQREDEARLSPLETTIGIMLPELDGCIEAIHVGGMAAGEKKELLDGERKESRALPEGIKRMAGRIRSWLALQHKPNGEKKLAIILYDYPPGEANLGAAGYLDAFKSLELFLQELAKAGYRVEVPQEDLGELLLSRGAVNTPAWSNVSAEIKVGLDLYRRWYQELPPQRREEIESVWGEPPGNIMAGKEGLFIPGVILGNIFIGVQPSRGLADSPEKAYHDKKLPPHHQYLCFYWWLQKEYQADCLIHWGTHGTLEFTGGKEAPLSHRCYPDILLGNIPHLYYYWVGNPAESTIAKRRSYAVMVSHASPPVTPAGLYGEYLELEELLAEYHKAAGQEKEFLAREIGDRAKSLSLPPAEPLELESYLYRMKRRVIPRGLHLLDRRLEGEELENYLRALLRLEGEVPSYYRLVAERMGYRYEEIWRQPEVSAAVETEVQQALSRWLTGEKNALPPQTGEYLQRIKEKIASSRESAGLLLALEGRYLRPNLAGDPLRSPEVYPVGGNMYEFDPRLIPTPLAQKRGQDAAQAVLEKFYRTHGHYPETVATVLWGFETLSTGGETIAQLLSYLGVRLVRKANPWFKELELIPLEELGRPRIDVFITICGIFRDICSPLIELLNQAVELAAGAAEKDEVNYVRKHSRSMASEHGENSSARIFGPAAGEYATSLRALVESGSWREEAELAQSYEGDMHYCYWRGRIKAKRPLFSALAATVEVVSQVRHSTSYEFTELDHYYEFFGGLSRNVAEKRGKTPEQFLVDTTEEMTEVAEVGLAIDRAVRTRLFNPRWIDEMLKHHHHGAQKIAERVEYLIGLKATTGRVNEWVFREALNRFLLDEKMRRRLSENNPFAALEIARRLHEAIRRDYLTLTAEELDLFQNAVLDLEGWVEERT